MNAQHGPTLEKVICMFITWAIQTERRASIKYISFPKKPSFVEKIQQMDLRPA